MRGGLRVGRVDFLRGTLTVAEQLTRGRHGSMATGEPKSDAGRRTLSVPAELMEMLAAHLARRGITGRDPAGFVFASPGGAPLDYTNWRRRVWKPATIKAGLDGLTFHDLRRANATGLVAEGVDVRTAQARLGHSDPRLTLAIYAQATGEADRSAAARIGARFLPRKDRRVAHPAVMPAPGPRLAHEGPGRDQTDRGRWLAPRPPDGQPPPVPPPLQARYRDGGWQTRQRPETRHPGQRAAPSRPERTTMTGYAVIIEGEPGSYSAYAPDLPGCVAAGETREEVEALMAEAIRLHVESLRAHGEPVPEPSAIAATIVQVA